MTLSHFFQSELEQNVNRVIEEVFPERMIVKGIVGALTEENQTDVPGLLPFNTSLSPEVTEFYYTVYNSKGIAEFYTHAADDVPQISGGADRLYGTQKHIALGDSFTYWDLLAAQKNPNQNAIQQSLTTIRRGIDVKLEDTYFLGEQSLRLQGFTNFPNVAVDTLPNDGVGTATTFASKSPDQKYRDLVSMALSVPEASKNVFFASVILLPFEIYNDLANTTYTSGSDRGESVLTVFLRNQSTNPLGIKEVIPVPFLSGLGTGGSGLGVVYSKRRDHIEAYISDYFHIFTNGNNGDDTNFKSSVVVTATCGGTVVYQPLSMRVFDGI